MVLINQQINHKFNHKEIEKKLISETRFINNLFASLAIPISAQHDDNFNQSNEPNSNHSKFPSVQNKTTRAHSLEELQSRLKVVRSKRNLNYKEKLTKKMLKNKLKKKTKKDERVLKQKLIKAHKIDKTNNVGNTNSKPQQEKGFKPIFNSEGKMVFSKFDFTGMGSKNEKKSTRDPKKLLKNLEEQKVKLNELEATGDKDKVTEMKEKFAWKNALAKAEGQKIKDDPILLKKSIHKKEHNKKQSEKKWKARIDGVKKAQDEKQRKRTENISKKKKEKKTAKLKKAVKRGKIIPGF